MSRVRPMDVCVCHTTTVDHNAKRDKYDNEWCRYIIGREISVQRVLLPRARADNSPCRLQTRGDNLNFQIVHTRCIA